MGLIEAGSKKIPYRCLLLFLVFFLIISIKDLYDSKQNFLEKLAEIEKNDAIKQKQFETFQKFELEKLRQEKIDAEKNKNLLNAEMQKAIQEEITETNLVDNTSVTKTTTTEIPLKPKNSDQNLQSYYDEYEENEDSDDKLPDELSNEELYEQILNGKIPTKEPYIPASELPPEELSRTAPNFEKSHRNALILSTWRSGWSFIANMIEKHPEIFYLFEPFVVTENMDNADKLKIKRKIASDYFSECKLPRYEDYFDEWRDSQLESINIDCKPDNICFREKGDKFKSPPICAEDVTELGLAVEEIHERCPLSEKKLRILEKICHEQKVRMIKSSRIASIDTAVPKKYLEDPDFTIILWVRDPRAIVNSRKKILGESFQVNDINLVCKEWQLFINQMKQKKWKARSLILRYEDFTNDFDYQSKELANYLGLSYPDWMSNYLFQVSHNGESRNPDEPWLSIKNEDMWEYATIRISAQTAYYWVQSTDFKTNIEIQKSCKNVMDTLGYKRFKKEADYLKFREYFNTEVFHWDMPENKVSTRFLYGNTQRQNDDPKFLEGFTRKLWGWDEEEFVV